MVVSEANKLLVKLEYTAPPEPTPSSPAPTPAAMAHPPPPHRRRFVAVDGFKPKVLGLDTTYEDFIDFKKRFITNTKACYEGVPLLEDGMPSITMEEWSSILLTRVEGGW